MYIDNKQKLILKEYRSVQTITIKALKQEIEKIDIDIIMNKSTPVCKALKKRKKELEYALIEIEKDVRY